MRVVDFIGNTLEAGDAVTVKQDHVIGVIQKIEDGQIAQGIITGEASPQAKSFRPTSLSESRRRRQC